MEDKKTILCIVPLPPPVTGAAMISEAVVKLLSSMGYVKVIEYQRGNLISGGFSIKQAFRILGIGIKILRLRAKHTNFCSVYMVVSCTFWGHMRDLFFLLALGREWRRKTILHIHSANVERDISVIPPGFLTTFTHRLFADVCRGVVLGKTWQTMYGSYIDNQKILEINNFFAPPLLISEETLSAKYKTSGKIVILFLSNMIKTKGYEMLLDAFQGLPQNLRNATELHFAGHFDSPTDKGEFQERIFKNKNIFYHDAISGDEKRDLLWKTHIFCLPTLYFYEAQPIVILEAYAAGSVVVTTATGGICDIFTDKKNGFFIDNFRDKDLMRNNLRTLLERAIADMPGCEKIAALNRKEAIEKYSIEKFEAKIEAAMAG